MNKTGHDWDAFPLLLIDVQRDFWPEKMVLHCPAFPSNVSSFLPFCRREGLEIVHLRARFRPDMSNWMPG